MDIYSYHEGERDFREGRSPSLTPDPPSLVREGGQGNRLLNNSLGNILSSWSKVQDIEPELLLPTPTVYFQVIDNVKGRGYLSQIVT